MRTFSWRASILSKRQISTDVAASEKSAKFTPLPSHVAPSGYGKPSQVFTEVISAPRSYRIWNTLAIIKIARFPPKLLALHSAARVAQPSLATVRAGDPARINATPCWKLTPPERQDSHVTRAGVCIFSQSETEDALKIHPFSWRNI